MPTVKGIQAELPCDLHLLNLKTLQKGIQEAPSDESTLLLHRVGYDCHFKDHCSERRVSENKHAGGGE